MNLRLTVKWTLISFISYFPEGTFEREKILHFLEHNKFPLVTKLTEMNSIRVYSSPVKRQVGHISHLHYPFELHLFMKIHRFFASEFVLFLF